MSNSHGLQHVSIEKYFCRINAMGRGSVVEKAHPQERVIAKQYLLTPQDF